MDVSLNTYSNLTEAQVILKKLEIHNYRPFGVPTTIEFESDVTILTGRNDVGKSAILNLIQALFLRTKIDIADVNNNYINRENATDWKSDKSIKVLSEFLTVDHYTQFFNHNVLSGSLASIRTELSSGASALTKIQKEDGNDLGYSDGTIKKFPNILFISNDTNDVISSQIDIESTFSTLENQFQ